MPEANWSHRVQDALAAGNPRVAEKVLLELVARVPARWKAVDRDPEGVYTLSLWDEEELGCWLRHHPGATTRRKPDSFSFAYFCLANLADRRGDERAALHFLDCALDLEPDHPLLWARKGAWLIEEGRLHEAMNCFEKAEGIRPWAPPHQRAWILREKAFVLVEFGQLNEAERTLHQSLELEPDHEAALLELEAIAALRRRGSGQPLWFAPRFAHAARN
jgi:tetratricopeptide (TPR) repeat protein